MHKLLTHTNIHRVKVRILVHCVAAYNSCELQQIAKLDEYELFTTTH